MKCTGMLVFSLRNANHELGLICGVQDETAIFLAVKGI